jgi:competence ComEA-like helix-hairpin-helix protein
MAAAFALAPGEDRMFVLTPAERRVAVLVAFLLALGTCWDLWQRRTIPPPAGAAADSNAISSALADPGVTVAADSLAVRSGSDPVSVATGNEARASAARGATLDLNRATAEPLDDLPGIGPVLARRIVAHREAHGPFRDPRDIRAVTGIGPKLYAKIRPYLHVGPDEVPTDRRAERPHGR